MNALALRRVAAGLVSAALWGLATRLPFVAIVIAATEIAAAWMNRDDSSPERAYTTLAKGVIVGGFWAAVGMLVFR